MCGCEGLFENAQERPSAVTQLLLLYASHLQRNLSLLLDECQMFISQTVLWVLFTIKILDETLFGSLS
jgi:hypothetical protein